MAVRKVMTAGTSFLVVQGVNAVAPPHAAHRLVTVTLATPSCTTELVGAVKKVASCGSFHT